LITRWPVLRLSASPPAPIPAPVFVQTWNLALALTPCLKWGLWDHLPPTWARKETMSPSTKILVSQLRLTIEYFSPSVTIMIRPSSMYTLAANRAGATRIKMDCSIRGVVAYSEYCRDEMARWSGPVNHYSRARGLNSLNLLQHNQQLQL
jgi:hypothetical protein